MARARCSALRQALFLLVTIIIAAAGYTPFAFDISACSERHPKRGRSRMLI